jgi:UDP-glucose:(heptosyl)LPS alpha-1,3-glucosyltransferase
MGNVSQHRNMKIALIHPKFGFTGGAERYAVGLARGLDNRGHQVHIFGRRFAGDLRRFKIHRIPAIPFGRGIKTWSFWKMSGRKVDPGRFDIVQGFGKTTCQTVHRTGGGTHAAFLKRGGNKPASFYDRVVLHIEDCLFSSSHLRLVICPSQWVSAEVRKQYPRMTARLETVPNGVDAVHFHPAGRSRDREALTYRLAMDRTARVMLLVATNFHLKGLDTAIGILSHMENAVLVVVGGDDPAPYVSLARQAGVADRIHFMGLQKDMAPLYRAADLLMHPTRYDPFANVCLEACACGTPVVTTVSNGFSDLLQDRRGGVVMPPDMDQAQGAGLSMDLLQRGPQGREAARALALENDLEMHVMAIEHLYREYAVPASEAKGLHP